MTLMKDKSGKLNLGAALLVGLVSGIVMDAGQALAYAPEGDLMKVKGFSPEVIQLTETQRSRQEWKTASAPKMSPTERFIHNIYYGDWTGDIDEFGSGIIREK
jgi:hypothetical protein